MNKIVYISGPMRASGRHDLNYPEFIKAAERAKQRGYDVLSPVNLDMAEFPTLTAEMAMGWGTEDLRPVFRRDQDAVLKSDAIAILQGWEKSAGAKAEVALAMALKLDILDAYNFHPIEISLLAYTHVPHVCSGSCGTFPEIELARQIADGD